jgi:hypothetical protein
MSKPFLPQLDKRVKQNANNTILLFILLYSVFIDKFLQICVLIVMYKDGRRKPKYAFSVFAAKVL